jgi:hypothetical protein
VDEVVRWGKLIEGANAPSLVWFAAQALARAIIEVTGCAPNISRLLQTRPLSPPPLATLPDAVASASSSTSNSTLSSTCASATTSSGQPRRLSKSQSSQAKLVRIKSFVQGEEIIRAVGGEEMEFEFLPDEVQQLVADRLLLNKCIHASALIGLPGATKLDVTTVRDQDFVCLVLITVAQKIDNDWLYVIADRMGQLQRLRLDCCSNLRVDDLDKCLPSTARPGHCNCHN